MTTNPNLQNVTGEEIAEELNNYGISVVGVGSPLPDYFMFKTNALQAFVERHSLTSATPFLNMRIYTVFCTDLLPGADEQAKEDIRSLGWRFLAADKVAPELVHKRIVGRLGAGQPVTLIPQTAKALRLNAGDLQTLPLTKVERFLLNGSVRWTRLRGKPLLICLDLENGRRQRARSQLSFFRYSPVNRFRRTRRLVVFFPLFAKMIGILRRSAQS